MSILKTVIQEPYGPMNPAPNEPEPEDPPKKPAQCLAWTREENDELALLVAEGLTFEEIADHLGRLYPERQRTMSKELVASQWNQRVQDSYPNIRYIRWTREENDELALLVAAGLTFEEIADHLGRLYPERQRMMSKELVAFQWNKRVQDSYPNIRYIRE